MEFVEADVMGLDRERWFRGLASCKVANCSRELRETGGGIPIARYMSYLEGK